MLCINSVTAAIPYIRGMSLRTLISSLFEKSNPGPRVQSMPGVAPALAHAAEAAIAQGRYRIYDPRPDGRAVLLLATKPRLIASVRKDKDAPGTIMVESVREADADIDRLNEEMAAL
ncbi:MAG: hypothetical protein JWN66_4375 [Sphingomonas bacterium]|uniref:hypothetical protein n=1 Tax=Sphingomonas bacterium TaxID=1895847 RepID=UPI002601600A|nr:hypothetical protein [Sphingomonas bacterium]MDB5707259.1 hypothetical protein [Sphingomonas bacterium]